MSESTNTYGFIKEYLVLHFANEINSGHAIPVRGFDGLRYVLGCRFRIPKITQGDVMASIGFRRTPRGFVLCCKHDTRKCHSLPPEMEEIWTKSITASNVESTPRSCVTTTRTDMLVAESKAGAEA